ncbi:MAG: hypothetical protein OXC28_07225 [Defluviicoccus sp.]|nr:hypothetical protein [Defluviicoccus sp.]
MSFTEIVGGTVVSIVIAICCGLFVRLRRLESRQDVDDERIEKLAEATGRIEALRGEMHRMQLCIERNFVRREDWVPHTSRVLGALEKQGRLLTRLDERLNQKEDHGR